MSEAVSKKGKRSFIKAAGDYFKGTKSEFKKVIWPTKKQVANNTTIVISAIILIGAVVFVLDAAFGSGLRMILSFK